MSRGLLVVQADLGPAVLAGKHDRSRRAVEFNRKQAGIVDETGPDLSVRLWSSPDQLDGAMSSTKSIPPAAIESMVASSPLHLPATASANTKSNWPSLGTRSSASPHSNRTPVGPPVVLDTRHSTLDWRLASTSIVTSSTVVRGPTPSAIQLVPIPVPVPISRIRPPSRTDADRTASNRPTVMSLEWSNPTSRASSLALATGCGSTLGDRSTRRGRFAKAGLAREGQRGGIERPRPQEPTTGVGPVYRLPSLVRETVFEGPRTIAEPVTSGYVLLERQVKCHPGRLEPKWDYRSPVPRRVTVFGGGSCKVCPSTWANGFALWHLKTTKFIRRDGAQTAKRLRSATHGPRLFKAARRRAGATRRRGGTVSAPPRQ